MVVGDPLTPVVCYVKGGIAPLAVVIVNQVHGARASAAAAAVIGTTEPHYGRRWGGRRAR